MRAVVVFLFFMIALLCNAQHLPAPPAKTSPSLSILLKRQLKHDSIDVIISLKDRKAFLNWKSRVSIISSYEPVNIHTVRIKQNELPQIINDADVVFADLYRKPKVELGSSIMDLSLNKINLAQRRFPLVNGQNIYASVKEERFDTLDIDIKGRYFNSLVAAPTLTTHASIMATMLGGAGNSTPQAFGVARGVNITSSDFANLMPDDDQTYEQYGITIQNHAYGTNIENFYGSDATAYDASIYNHLALMHVFSAGNSGTQASPSGNYTGVANFANLTGSFKMAKNILTVGSTDSFGVVMEQSSKGPAYDGRIKPELVAFGQDGSSGAAALVSGTISLLQDQYKVLHGNLPSAALTKAVIVNSANNSRPDYSSGFGSLDAHEALSTLSSQHFFEGEIEKNQTKIFPLVVPSGIARAKIMLVWTDPPATANAPKALLNDLDAELSLPSSGETWLPWVLNYAAHTDSLQLAATRKKDTLNNIEQITIDNPKPGNYNLTIDAQKIVSDKQQFAVAYQFDTIAHFDWTFPTSTDKLESNKATMVRWQSNIEAQATLEYSLNSGSWIMLNQNTNIHDQLFYWSAPDTATTAKLRMTIPSLNIMKETEEFVVSPFIDLKVGFDCPDSVLLYWSNPTGSSYEVYQLGQKYMEPIKTTSDSFVVLQKNTYPSPYFGVARKIGGYTGMRSYTLDYSRQGSGCYFQSFFASLQNDNAALLEVNLGSLYQVESVTIQKLTKNVFTDIYTIDPPAGNFSQYTDNNLKKGINSYRTVLSLANDRTIYSSVQSVFYLPDDPVFIFPNPVRSNQPFRLISDGTTIYSVYIFDINGKQIYKGVLDLVDKQIQSINLPKGIYLIRFNSIDRETFSKKLIVL